MTTETQNANRFEFGFRVEGGAGILTVRGPVMATTMKALRAEIFRATMMNDLERVLCDFSSAIILLAPEEWQAFTGDWLSEHSPRLPLALLVGVEAIDDAALHCHQMTAHGRICLAFAASQRAYRWVGAVAPSRALASSDSQTEGGAA